MSGTRFRGGQCAGEHPPGGRIAWNRLLNTVAATATATYIAAHGPSLGSRRPVHRYSVAFALGAGILAAAAIVSAAFVTARRQRRWWVVRPPGDQPRAPPIAQRSGAGEPAQPARVSAPHGLAQEVPRWGEAVRSILAVGVKRTRLTTLELGNQNRVADIPFGAVTRLPDGWGCSAWGCAAFHCSIRCQPGCPSWQ